MFFREGKESTSYERASVKSANNQKNAYLYFSFEAKGKQSKSS
jgi:hypothetical protein